MHPVNPTPVNVGSTVNAPIIRGIADIVYARLLLAVADAREDNYDWQQHLLDLEKTLVAKKEARALGKDDTYINECKEHYHRETFLETAERVCTSLGYPRFAYPIYLILSYTWNDALDWVEREFNLKATLPVWREEWEAKMEALYESYK